MLEFGRSLEEYIKRSGMSVKSASEYLGMNRTTLQHIISGDRKLKNVDEALEIGQKLMLTSDEMEEFISKYKISVMGEATYRRRNKVAQFLEQISETANFHTAKKVKLVEPDIDSDVLTVNNKIELLEYIQQALCAAVDNESEITIIAQPSESLNMVLFSCLGNEHQKAIDHIFCVDNNYRADAANENNLEILRLTYQIAINIDSYTPLYYYDNISAHINSNSLLPYCIITDKYAITCDNEYESGIIYSNPDTVSFYKKCSERIKGRCQRLFTRPKSFAELPSLNAGKGGCRFEYGYQPCISAVTPPDLFMKHVKIPENERAIYLKYAVDEAKRFLVCKPCDIFYEAGLKDFIDNGFVASYPESFYSVPTEEVRQQVLRSMIEMVEKGTVDFRALVNDKPMRSIHFEVNASDDYVVLFLLLGERIIHLNITEPGLIKCFTDYFEYICKNGTVLDKEGTLEILRKYLR